MDDTPITTEAGIALGELEIPFSHLSQPLTKKLLAECDQVFAMETRHVDAVLELTKSLPTSSIPNISLLDEEREIRDPLGGNLSTYRKLARHLIKIVPERLCESNLFMPCSRFDTGK